MYCSESQHSGRFVWEQTIFRQKKTDARDCYRLVPSVAASRGLGNKLLQQADLKRVTRSVILFPKTKKGYRISRDVWDNIVDYHELHTVHKWTRR